jgi:ppGpp synthetase/RelA/SpoT-type nucleotidyltranferase
MLDEPNNPNLKHEIAEFALMQKGMPYWKAHKLALKAEKKPLRIFPRINPVDNPDEIETYRSSFNNALETTASEFQQMFPGRVSYRIKSRESIIEKLGRKGKRIEELTDIAGIRVTFLTLDLLYKGLEKIRNKFNVVEEEDYINQPQGGYRSYHLIIMVQGKPIEVQLKTYRMFEWSESGHDVFYKGKSDLEKKYGPEEVSEAEKYRSTASEYYQAKDEGKIVPKPKTPSIWMKMGLPMFLLNPTEAKKYKYYYHATPTINVNHILTYGLIPGKGRSLVSGLGLNGVIYLNNDYFETIDYIREVTRKYPNSPREWSILKVELPKGRKVYIDNETASHEDESASRFVYGWIPPQNIQDIKKRFMFNSKGEINVNR